MSRETLTEGDATARGASPSPAAFLARSPRGPASIPLKGEVIGRYVVLDRLGAGAMGVVLAAYDPELDRKIALKLIKGRDRATLQAHARLKREAQALAKLNHPNVVSVYDVGIHSEQLFIAMEFIAGQTLREWMDAETRTPAQIEAVFTAAGRGLAAAHAAGLIHRDFKPDNVMIADDGSVRVMDFGLARTGPADDEASPPDGQTLPAFEALETQLTRTGMRLGTPAYMSLEQLRGLEVDARSDQFSFCVSLYEALHGERPFKAVSWMELEARLEADHLPPAPAGVRVPAAMRSVLARGLASDPDARFPTMEALLEALAPPQTPTHRRLIGLGLALTTVAALAGVAKFGARDDAATVCQLPEDKFEGVWDEQVRDNIAASFRATDTAFAEDTLARVAAGLDAHVDHWRELNAEVCEATMVRKQVPLERMAEQMHCLDRNLRRVAGLTAVLQQADAKTVARALDSVQSLEAPDACRKTHLDEPEALSDARRGDLLDVEAEVAKAEAYIDLGRYEEALETSTQATRLALELGDVGGRGRASLARFRALSGLGRYEDASEGGLETIDLATQSGDDETRAKAQIALVRVHTHLGRFDVAEGIGLVTEALVRDAKLGTHLEALLALRLSLTFRKQQRWDEAELLLVRGLDLVRALYGPDHPELAIYHNSLGNLLLRGGKELERAEEHYREALHLWRTHYGDAYPSVTAARNNLGALHQLRGELDEARREFQAALDSQTLLLGEDHPQNLPLHLNLASVEVSQGQTRAARDRYAFGYDLARERLDPRHPRVAAFAFALGQLELELGEREAGEAHLREALDIYIERRGAEHSRTAATHLALALWLQTDGRADEARAHLDEAHRIYAAAPLGEDSSRAQAHYAAGLRALAAREYERAIERATQGRELAEAVYGPRTQELPTFDLVIIEARLAQGDHAGALAQARIATDGPAAQPNDRRLWRLALLRAQLERHEGHDEQARQAYERALALTLGPDGNPERALVVLADMRAFVAQSDPARAAALTELAANLRRQIEDAARPPAAAITAQ